MEDFLVTITYHKDWIGLSFINGYHQNTIIKPSGTIRNITSNITDQQEQMNPY